MVFNLCSFDICIQVLRLERYSAKNNVHSALKNFQSLNLLVFVIWKLVRLSEYWVIYKLFFMVFVYFEIVIVFSSSDQLFHASQSYDLWDSERACNKNWIIHSINSLIALYERLDLIFSSMLTWLFKLEKHCLMKKCHKTKSCIVCKYYHFSFHHSWLYVSHNLIHYVRWFFAYLYFLGFYHLFLLVTR